jgi:hypothetical protein
MTWTYSQLQTKIGTFLNRSDLTASIPDFITLAEAKMNRRLDCRQMVEIATISLTGETYAVPTGFAGVKSFRLNTDPVQALEYRNAEEFDDVRLDAYAATGRPTYFTVSGSSFYFSPAPDSTYSARLRYRKKIPSLSDTVTTNWLIEEHPDAYLYGALMHSAPFLMADERLSVWGALYESAISEINGDDARQNQAARPSARVKRIG